MRIFISWSGPRAKAAALLLRDWLPSVIQLLDVPWVSDVDIESGANWSATIGANLSEAKYGIVCVTQENQNRPWLNFEAGAISKLIGGCTPLLIDFESKADLSGGPMSQLQIRMPDREDMSKLLGDVNRRLERPLDRTVLATSFDRAFAEFEHSMRAIVEDPSYAVSAPERTNDEKLDELLALARVSARFITGERRQSLTAGMEELLDLFDILGPDSAPELLGQLSARRAADPPARRSVRNHRLHVLDSKGRITPWGSPGDDEDEQLRLDEEYQREKDFEAWDAAGRPGAEDVPDETDYSAVDE